MKMIAAAVSSVLMLAGCGSVRYPTSYLLNLPAPAPQSATPEAGMGSVAVREFRCPEYLCEGRIVYRPTAEEVGFYEHHRWAVSPRQAVTQSVVNALRARSLFSSVAYNERGVEAEYVLTGAIERLEEVDEGRDVRAVCSISAQLVDTNTRTVVWHGAVSETIPVERRDVAGVVSSLSAATRTAVHRLVSSMDNELAAGEKRRGAAELAGK